ncbi:hypothetical protein QA596_00745 [Balneolales bacterium ANBcel1]|nr:hypothetical protein [Balneolales bacterium ANBcel1]
MSMDTHHTTLSDRLTFPEENRISVGFLAAGIIGVILSLIGLVVNTEQFFYSYLTSFAFIASLVLGALFFVMVQHVTRSSWSVVIRRIPETISYQLVWLGILFIPILFGMEILYEWTRPERIATDALTQHKLPYLNLPFFIIRNIIYFAVWAYLGYKLYRNSIAMDRNPDPALDRQQRVLSAPGLLIFAFTVAFASFDWLMSMDSHWFSTMFGVYYFAMSFQTILAVVIALVLYLFRKGLLTNTINKAHIHDLGAFLFGFSVFYAYIAFSQFLLIYYANIPEATLWFYYRFEGNWIVLAWLFLIGRFVIPFVLLLKRKAKTNYKLLMGVSLWIIALQFLEMFWIVMPILHQGAFSIHWLDIALLLAFFGISAGLFFRQFGKHSMIPKNDPLLTESLNKH